MSRSSFGYRGQSGVLRAMASSLPVDKNGSSGEEPGPRHSRESPSSPVTEPGQQPRQPISIGEQLSAARHRLGLSIAQAASDTRIEAGYLEALEADAPISPHRS
jgi:hypothetical protein